MSGAGRGASTLIALAILAAPASADWKASFREGVKAYDQKRWEECAQQMKDAIADRPFADKVKVLIFSSKRISYVPNTFLGIALHRLERCEEALPYFEQAEVQNIAPDYARNYYREMVEAKTVCVNQLMGTAIDRATRELEGAQEAANAIAVLNQQSSAPLDAEPQLRARHDQAIEALRNASALVQAGIQESSLRTVQQGADNAATARTQMAAVRADLETLVSSGAANALAGARRAVAAAWSAREDLTRLKGRADVSPIWSSNRSYSRRESDADEKLGQAESRLAQPAEAGQAGDLARQAQSAYQSLSDALRDSLARAARAERDAATAARRLENAIADAERGLQGLAEYRGRLGRRWDTSPGLGQTERELRAQLDQAREILATAGGDPAELGRGFELASAADRGFLALARDAERLLGEAISAPDAGPTPPSGGSPSGVAPAIEIPRALRTAAEALFSGRYAEVSGLLENGGFDDARLDGQRLLLLAAADFARYRAGGATEESLREAAIARIAAGKAADPQLRAGERFFSPPFVELFAATPPGR